MLAIHPNARTTPPCAPRSPARASTPVLSWPSATASPPRRSWRGRRRGPEDCRDRSSRPHKLPWKASEEERAVVRERRAMGFPLDELTFRSAISCRTSTATTSTASSARGPEPPAGPRDAREGRGQVQGVRARLRPPGREAPCPSCAPPTASGAGATCSWPSIAARARSTWRSRTTRARPAPPRLREAAAAFPFRVTHVLTDRGSCFTAEGFEKACREHGASSTARPGPARRARTAWPSASTAGSSARCSASRRPATAIRAAAGGLQRGLRRPPAARPGRPLARAGRPRAPGAGHEPRQPRLLPNASILASCSRRCSWSNVPRTSAARQLSTSRRYAGGRPSRPLATLGKPTHQPSRSTRTTSSQDHTGRPIGRFRPRACSRGRWRGCGRRPGRGRLAARRPQQAVDGLARLDPRVLVDHSVHRAGEQEPARAR